MPVYLGSIPTGVSSAQIVKAAAQQERTMSQDNVDQELAELQAELQEEMQELVPTQPAVQEDVPAGEEEDIEAALAALGTQEEPPAEEEDVDAALTALGTQEAPAEEEEDVDAVLQAIAAEAQGAREEEEAVKPTASAEQEPAEEAEAPAAPAVVPTHPTSEPAAESEDPMPDPAAPSAGSSGANTKPAAPQLGKRKPALFVKKAEPKAAAAAVTSGPSKPAPSKPVAITKKVVKARPAPPANAPADAPAVAAAETEMGPMEEGRAADNKENYKPKPAPKPAPKPKLTTKPATKKAAAGTEAGAAVNGSGCSAATVAVAAPAAPKIKRPLNSYLHFSQSRRAQIKADHPDLDNKELTCKVAELFKALTPEDKAPFEAAAAADKVRYNAEVEAAGGAAAVAAAKPAKGAKKEAAPKAKGPKAKRAKSAYSLFCDAQLPEMRANNPQASMAELWKELAVSWTDISPEAKAVYEGQAKELKAAAKEAAGEEGEAQQQQQQPAQKKKRPAAGSAGGRKAKKGKVAAAVEDAAEEDEEMAVHAVEDEDDGDDEEERMNCDWESHPAEMILGQTSTGKFLVLRRGLGLADYGLVDEGRVKAQRLGGSTAEPCPVGLALLEEYEAYCKAFKREVHDNTERGELELSGLPQASLLESCFYLGKLREPGYELSRAGKNDVMMRVPLLATCHVMQRLLMAERQRAKRLQQRVAELEGMVAASGLEQAAAAVGGGSSVALAGKAANADLTPGKIARQQGVEA